MRSVIAVLAGLMLLGAAAHAQTAEEAPPELTVDSFYDALAPVGQWVFIKGLDWCWRPSAAEAGADFEPYASGGQWARTDQGWEFQSQWEWGDIVFHYGRWYQDEQYGWLWVPGTEWAPNQVEWRENNDYIGWAPAPPAGVEEMAPAAWLFVPVAMITIGDIPLHCLSQTLSVHVFSQTRPTQVTHVAVQPITKVSASRFKPVAGQTQHVHLTPLAGTHKGGTATAPVRRSAPAAAPSVAHGGAHSGSRHR